MTSKHAKDNDKPVSKKVKTTKLVQNGVIQMMLTLAMEAFLLNKVFLLQ